MDKPARYTDLELYKIQNFKLKRLNTKLKTENEKLQRQFENLKEILKYDR